MTEQNNPQLDPETAYAKLDEDNVNAEMMLLDKYQSFSAEIIRLSLLGIAVFGFLYKEVLAELIKVMEKKKPELSLDYVKYYAICSIVLFGLATILALIYRYLSTDSMRFYLDGLRYHKSNCPEKSREKLNKRKRKLTFCVTSKIGFAVSFGGAVVTLSIVLIMLLDKLWGIMNL